MKSQSETLLDERGLPRGLFFSARIAKRGALLLIKVRRGTPNKQGVTQLTTSVSLAGTGFYEAYNIAAEKLVNFICDDPQPCDLDLLKGTADAFAAHYRLTLKSVTVLVDA